MTNAPNPKSNILSASSKTRNETRVKLVDFILMWSMMRPGVQTMISAPSYNDNGTWVGWYVPYFAE